MEVLNWCCSWLLSKEVQVRRLSISFIIPEQNGTKAGNLFRQFLSQFTLRVQALPLHEQKKVSLISGMASRVGVVSAVEEDSLWHTG